MLTVDGLISGIDTEKVVDGLLQVQRRRTELYETQRSKVLARQAAMQSLSASLVGFRLAASSLGRFQSNVFQQRTVAVSHDSRLTASARNNATPGVYSLTIESLARAHQVASQSFTSVNAEITQGTLELRIGQKPPATITIDDTNNSVQGLIDAINDANLGVSAAFVSDGLGGGRILLSSKTSGADGAITLTNSLAGSSGSAVLPEFDFDDPVQAAQNATVRLGSGAGAITISSSTNTITDAIPGVTLNLVQADPATELTLTVSPNTQAAVTAIEDFVASYNGLLENVAALTRFNPETGEAGLLNGDRSVRDIVQTLRDAVLSTVPGLAGNANRLSRLGITVGDTGKLSLNTARLQEVLQGRDPSLSLNDARRIFGLDAVSTHPGVRFVLGSSRTQASTVPYGVNVTRAAERAVLTAGDDLSAATTIDATNDTLELTVDGASLSIKLNHGEYSRSQLAGTLHTAINAQPDLLGRSVTVDLSGDRLRIASDSYGSASSLVLTGGSLLADLGFSGQESANGVDVAGEYLVAGGTEPATGRGRLLVGDSNNLQTADLQVLVSLSADQLIEGAEAELTVTKGVASRLDDVINRLLAADTGRLAVVNNRFNQELESLAVTIDRQNALFEKQQQRLIAEFVALESALAQLQSTSSLLGSQLAALNGLASQRR